MASVRKTFSIEAAADQVWAALADFHNVHKRVAPGFVIDSKPDGDARIVKFSNGTNAREVLVDRDAKLRRLVYAVAGSERLTHHSASVQVFAAAGQGSRVVWMADLLPNAMRSPIEAMKGQGLAVMKKTLDAEGSSQ